MRRNRVLFALVLAFVLAGCGDGSGSADETSGTGPGGDPGTTTEVDSGGDNGNGEPADTSARLAEVCGPAMAAASNASGIEFAPGDDSSVCQAFDSETAATVQVTIQPRLDFEGNECDAIGSGSVPESFGDTGSIIDTTAGAAFSGEQSDIAQVIGCDDEFRYLAQASAFDDSPAIALRIYEVLVGA